MTIRDVAEYCGTSVSTVSRVLNNRPDVSKEVRQKVMDAVKELHYIPNNSARDLVRTSSDSIGVIVRGAGNPFFTALIHSIENAITEAGYTMIISQIPSTGDEIEAGASLARSKRLNGLLFLGGCFDYSEADVATLGVPFVCCTYTNSFGSLKDRDYSSVSIDDRAEAARAVKLLLKKGHKKIGIILDKKDDHSIGQLRYMGYLDALNEAGIEPDMDLVEEVGAYEMDAAYEGTLRLIKRRSDVTALFVIADSLAIAAMKALHELGKNVPDDCSLISIDGIETSLYTIPTLTTLTQPREVLGREAVRTLINVLEERNDPDHIRLATGLREGGTVKALS